MGGDQEGALPQVQAGGGRPVARVGQQRRAEDGRRQAVPEREGDPAPVKDLRGGGGGGGGGADG